MAIAVSITSRVEAALSREYSLSYGSRLFTAFNYRDVPCLIGRLLANATQYVGLVKIVETPSDAQLNELCGVMHLGRPMIIVARMKDKNKDRRRYYIGFHTLHAADHRSMPGGSPKSIDYVAEELKRGIDFMLPRPHLASLLQRVPTTMTVPPAPDKTHKNATIQT